MKIGEILSRAWKIIWKHKILWLFGILASCGQSGGSSGGAASGGSAGSQNLFMPVQHWVDFGEMEFVVILLIIAASVAFLFLVLLVTLALNAVGRIGLVRGVLQAEAGKEKLSFGELLSEVKPFFWRVVGLNLLVGASMLVLALAGVVAFVIIAVVTLGFGVLLLIPLALLAVPLAWAVVVVLEQANVALIVEDISILEALKRAWLVVKAHLAEYLIMVLILILGVGLLGMLVLGLPVVLVAAPALVGLVANESNWSMAGIITSAVCFSLYLPFLIVGTGILRSYIITAWTLTYLRLATPAPQAPLVPPEPKMEAMPAPLAEVAKPDESLPNPLTGS